MSIKPKVAKQNKAFDAKAFAKAIVNKRETDAFSLTAAAEWTGLSRITIFRAESLKPITIDTLVIICNWLGVPVQTFFQ